MDKQIIHIDGLMGAMKIAHTEMNDACSQIGAAIVRAGYVSRQTREGAGGKFDAHDLCPPNLRGRPHLARSGQVPR